MTPTALRLGAATLALGALAATAVLGRGVGQPGTPVAPAASSLIVTAGTARPSAAPGARADEVSYAWPLAPAAVVRPFDDPAEPWLAGHRGADLGGSLGQAVTAAAAGTVAFAGVVAGKPVVSIDHADGIRTTYEPVTASVAAGDAVAQGTVIGLLGSGHGPSVVLHWGARTGPRTYIDPVLLVSPPAVIRLYPEG